MIGEEGVHTDGSLSCFLFYAYFDRHPQLSSGLLPGCDHAAVIPASYGAKISSRGTSFDLA